MIDPIRPAQKYQNMPTRITKINGVEQHLSLTNGYMVFKVGGTGEGDYLVIFPCTVINTVHYQFAFPVLEPTCEKFTNNP